MTPEGRTKKDIKDLFFSRGLIAAGAKECNWPKEVTGWYYMPVPNGLGVHGIPDFVGFYLQKFFVVEAKAPGNLDGTTPNQENRIKEIITARGHAIVADSAATVEALLDRIKAEK